MTEKKTEKEELLEKLSKTEELLGKISKFLEDPNKGIETDKGRELAIDIAKLQADSPLISDRKINETKPSETKSKKMVRRSVAVALGITCILLIAGLGGTATYYNMKINAKESQINTANNMGNQLNATITNQNNTIVSLNDNIMNLTNEKNQLQTWLDGNETLLNQTQIWLNGNVTLLLAENANYKAQMISLNAHIAQLQTWLTGNISAYNSLQSTYNDYVSDHSNTNEQYNQMQTNYTNELKLYDAFYNISNLADSAVWENNDSIQQPASQYTNWTESVNYAGYVSVYVQSSNVTGTHVAIAYSAYGANFTQENDDVTVGGTAVFPILPSTITVFVGNGNLGFEGGASETVTITYYY